MSYRATTSEVGMAIENNELLSLRLGAKLTQEDLATQIGISQSQVSRYEQEPDSATMAIHKAWRQVCGQISARQPLEYGAPYAEIRSQIQLIASYAETAPATLDPTVFQAAPDPKEIIGQIQAIGRKPRLAFCGRFDQGKSQLANTLMGGNYLPTGYQPLTSLLCLVRHISDRPSWFKEDVWIMSKGFDFNLGDDQEHCLKHRVVAGSFDTLRRYGTHQDNPLPDSENHSVALVYIDSPFLLGCDIVDLPGYGNSQADQDKVEMAHSLFDILVYASTADGFLQETDLQYIHALLGTLPAMEAYDASVPVLRNVYLVATKATMATEALDDILTKSSDRSFRHLHEDLERRAMGMGRPIISQEDFRKRFFTYLIENPTIRENFELDLTDLLKTVFPVRVRARVDQGIAHLKKDAKTYYTHWTKQLVDALDSRDEARHNIDQIEQAEPERLHKIDTKHRRILEIIADNRRRSAAYISTELQSIITVDKVEEIIRSRYDDDKKEAKQLAGTYITNHVQNKLTNLLGLRAKELAPEIDDILDCYRNAGNKVPGMEVGLISVPFDAQGIFLGALVGVGTFGALSAWAAAAAAGSNLGAYLLVPTVVSWLSSIGISVGGTAAAISMVSAIGGPVTIGIGLAVIAAITVWSLFGSSWQHRLAKGICAALKEKKFLDELTKLSNKFWDDTTSGFDSAMETTEKAFQESLESLQHLVRATTREEITAMINQVEATRDFFGGIPWRAAN
jgi:transcriptional regulator with XRE-family HTH domain